jgi:hypothetical protein
MSEVIYVLINESMPGLIMIGKITQNEPQQYKDELHNSHPGVPLPFTCVYAAEVADASGMEKRLFETFARDRINPQRAFLTTVPYKVISILKKFEITNQNAAIQEEIDKNISARERRAIRLAVTDNSYRNNVDFSEIDLPIGTELTFAVDETQKCVIVNNQQVEYEGNRYFLSTLTLKLLDQAGYNRASVNGPAHFLYQGELLSERRDRIEFNVD